MKNLTPAIIQDARTNQILMLGYMNDEAYKKTLETKKVWFFSRSKKRLWQKGETSGNYLEVLDIKKDCDKDAFLIKTIPKGPTCHTGKYSCFGQQEFSLQKLYDTIKSRKKEMPKGSYTAELFKQGLPKICDKIQEESEEVVKAAKAETKDRLTQEISDLLYHLTVLMNKKEVLWSDVISCLKKRHLT